MARLELHPTTTRRLRPLLEILEPVHGEGLRACLAWGPWLLNGGAERPATALIVLDDASPASLRRTAPRVGQLRRERLEPLFLAVGEVAAGADAFPLEFLCMQAAYEVVRGEDVLAGLTFPPAALRLQLEEDLRSLLHCFRQEVARDGHQPRRMRQLVAQTSAELERVWHGLLRLRGGDDPAEPEALAATAAEAWRLDPQLLGLLRRIETGQDRPTGPELDAVVDRLGALLAELTALVDALEA